MAAVYCTPTRKWLLLQCLLFATLGFDQSHRLVYFYDHLMCQIHSYCNDNMFFICGDFNGRCGDLEDYIPGIDNIPERHVIDYYTNKEGEAICDFLIATNCCMLNGRNSVNNDYTFIGPQGNSVVNYCFIPFEFLNSFSNFIVTTEKTLFNKTNLLGQIEPNTSHPEHLLLTWESGVWLKQIKKKKREHRFYKVCAKHSFRLSPNSPRINIWLCKLNKK